MTAGAAALSAGIAATASTAAAGTTAAVSGKMNKKTLKYNKWALQKQREWSLQDTADQRAYNEQLYEKYQSPLALKNQYKEAGYSPYAALGQSANISPVQSMNNSDTSASANTVAAANSQYANGMATAANQMASGVSNAALQYEQIRSLKIDNDWKQQENENKNSIADMEVTLDDFPQLYGYDKTWFEGFKKRTGHNPTFRDLYSMAIFKQLVHQCNATAGHEHSNGISGWTFEWLRNNDNVNRWESSEMDENGNVWNGYSVQRGNGISKDGLNYLGRMFLADLSTSESGAKYNALMAEWEQFKKDNGFRDSEKSGWHANKKQNEISESFATYDAWYTRAATLINDLLSSANLGTQFIKGLKSLNGEPITSSKTNYKPDTSLTKTNVNPYGRRH